MIVSLLVFGCAGGDKAPADDSATTPTDTGTDWGPNPVVPEAYASLWDVDVSSCDEGDDAIVYHLFSGTTDGASLSGTEGYYWFFKTEGWEGDCVDTFTVEGTASDTNWQEDPCSGCDFEYTSSWNLQDGNRGCAETWDYEDFFANDRVDADRFNTIVMLDPLSPSGNVNETTLVMMAYQDDDDTNSYTFDNAYGRGQMVPEVEGDWEGAASVEWVGGSGWCIQITGG